MYVYEKNTNSIEKLFEKYIAMAEGTCFENPTFEPDHWDEDDYGDETTPFFPNGASTPAFDQYQTHVQEEIEMKTMQQAGGPDTSYVETSFGAPKSSEQAWVAAKDLFPKMSSSELEVSYNTKGRLQVKIFGAGKKTYNLMTTERSTGREQINKSLPKEIQNALGETKYEMQREDFKKLMDEKTQEIEKENNNLKVLEESDDASEIEKSRAKIRVLQIEKESLKSEYNLADLRNSGAPQKKIEKQQAEVRNFASDFTKARGDYNRRYPSESFESNTRPQFEEVPNDEEPEIFDERQRIKSIIKQNEALRSRMVSDRYISENQEKTPEVREAGKKKNEEEKRSF